VEELNFDYALLIPEFLLAATGGLLLMVDAFRRELKVGRNLLPWITVGGSVAAALASLPGINRSDDFAGIVAIDNFTTFFRVLFALTLAVIVVGSHEFVTRHIRHQGEFYTMLIFATIGATFMAASTELLTAYVGVELLSFSLYVAVSLAKSDPRSGEAGLKYVLLGGLASAILLYGLSLIYGTGGSTDYATIAANFEAGTAEVRMPMILGLTMVIAGLGFKASAVPFHMWTPDAYEGAPLPVTAILSATSKAAAFGLLLRLFGGPLLPVIDDWQGTIAVMSLLTMVVGNLIALQQRNIKRLLAYSSIGQVGFMLLAILTVSDASASALLLHLGGYLVTNLAVFMAVIAFYNQTGSEEISAMRGLAQTNPYLALVIATGLFSLSGMPLLAGFTTKFILFQAAASGGYLWLVTIAVIASTISLYYYLMVIRQMYVLQTDGHLVDPQAPDQRIERWRLTTSGYLVTAVLFVGIFVVGLYVSPLATAADRAAAALFS
jgi:NADH-quinone oxidoreductase subunit N